MPIVPTNRLLVWVLFVVAPFGALATAAPSLTALSIAVVLLFLALAMIDAAGSLHRLDGIDVSLPALVRLVKHRSGTISVDLLNAPERKRPIRLGLPLPPELPTAESEWSVQLPDAVPRARVQIVCRPTDRGSYRLDMAYLETNSQLGLWSVRAARPVQCELRVYPDLRSERKHVAAIFLDRANAGRHAHRQLGKGRDFEKLREYVPGDSFEDLHWKATARRGRPITKVFQMERTQEVYVVIDASRLSARRVTSNTSEPPAAALERFITAALVLGLAAERQGDLFGLLVFSDKIQSFVRARNGRAHFNSCREALYALQPQIVTPDLEEVTSFIRIRLRRRALLVFLTALDDPLLADSFVRNIELISRQHIVVVNMLRPSGLEPFFFNPQVDSVNDIYERLGGHLQWQHLRELKKVLHRRGVRLSLVDHERLTSDLVSDYLRIKARQLL